MLQAGCQAVLTIVYNQVDPTLMVEEPIMG